MAVDSLAYGRLTVVPWNIVKYNIFGGSERGPDLYGTEPWYFYVFNLLLNFNILVPLALASLPALALTYRIDHKRLGAVKPSPDQSSPFTLLSIRLAPFYVWFGILTAQAHKEERFMFPAYPMLVFNAAVTIYLIRGWIESTYIKITKSPYRVCPSLRFLKTFADIFIAGIAVLDFQTCHIVHSVRRYPHLCVSYHGSQPLLPCTPRSRLSLRGSRASPGPERHWPHGPACENKGTCKRIAAG